MPRAPRKAAAAKPTPEPTPVALAGEDLYLRVQPIDNPKAEITIRAVEFDPKAHKRLNKPALDNHGEPAPPKYRKDLRAPATTEGATESTAPAGDAAGETPGTDSVQPDGTENGHQADTEKE